MMLNGRKGRVNGAYIIQIDGYPRIRFYGYSKRDAERKYRQKYNLVGRRVEWLPQVHF